MDISCHSELTQDCLIPEDGNSSSFAAAAVGPLRTSSGMPRRFLRKQSSSDSTTPAITSLRRDVTDSSLDIDNSFHTAKNYRVSDLCVNEAAEAEQDQEDDHLDDLEFPEDSDSLARELDEQAEQAARNVFGADAHVVDGPKTRSALVSENACIDGRFILYSSFNLSMYCRKFLIYYFVFHFAVSWFAARGLMSRRSFERYQKEMKSKVISLHPSTI